MFIFVTCVANEPWPKSALSNVVASHCPYVTAKLLNMANEHENMCF